VFASPLDYGSGGRTFESFRAYDNIAINAEVFVQARVSFDVFDQLIQRA